MAGLAATYRRGNCGVAGNVQRRHRNARATEPEATGIDVLGRVAARAVAVEVADRHVVARRRHDRDVDKARRHRRRVAGQAPAHALVHARHGVDREVAGGGVALRAYGRGGDVVGRLRRCGQQVGREGRGCDVAVAAVTARRVLGVEGRGARVRRGGRAAGKHADVGRGLVTGRAGGNGGADARVTGHVQGWTRDAGRAELEAPGVDVGRGVTAGAIAVEAPDRYVVARRGDDGDVVEGRRHARPMAGQAAGDALVGAGHGVDRVVARGRVALGAGCRGRDVVGRLAALGDVAGKRRRRR